jgi:hypothetical protein
MAKAWTMDSLNTQGPYDPTMILQLVDAGRMLDRQIISEMSRLAGSAEAHHEASSGKCREQGIDSAPRAKIKQNIKLLGAKESKRSQRIEDRKPDYLIDMIHHASNVVVAWA